MTVGRHRVFRGTLLGLEIMQLVFLFTKEEVSTDLEVRYQSSLATLTMISIVLQILALATVRDMNRTYNQRAANDRSSVERLTNAPVEFHTNVSRNVWVDRSFVGCVVLDFFVRVFRYILLLAVLPFFTGYSCAFLFECVVVFLGMLSFTVMLLFDQDYLRDLMTWCDLLTNRDRVTGYHAVYCCGYQFSSQPGMMFLTLPIIYAVFSWPQTVGIVLTTAVDCLAHHDSSAGLDFETSNITALLIDWGIAIVSLYLVPVVFWLEDDPEESVFFLLPTGLSLGLCTLPQYIFKIYILVPEYHMLDSAEAVSSAVDYGLDVVLQVNQCVYVLAVCIFISAVCSFTEYLSAARSRNAWRYFLCLSVSNYADDSSDWRRAQSLVLASSLPVLYCSLILEPLSGWLLMRIYNILPTVVPAIWFVHMLLWFLWSLHTMRLAIVRPLVINVGGYRIAMLEIQKWLFPGLQLVVGLVALIAHLRRHGAAGNISWEHALLLTVASIRVVCFLYWLYHEFVYSKVAEVAFYRWPEGNPEDYVQPENLHRQLRRALWILVGDGTSYEVHPRPTSLVFNMLNPGAERDRLLRYKRFYGLSDWELKRLRDLNYAERRMGLFMATTARPADRQQCENIVKRLADHDFHVAMQVVSFL